MKTLLAALIALLLMLPTSASAAGDIVVTMSAYNGSLTADQSTGTVQLQVDGQPPLTFQGATISVNRSRIDVIARTHERTLVAWILRRSGAGGVGLLLRTDNPRKPLKFGFRPTSFDVEGEAPITIIRR